MSVRKNKAAKPRAHFWNYLTDWQSPIQTICRANELHIKLVNLHQKKWEHTHTPYSHWHTHKQIPKRDETKPRKKPNTNSILQALMHTHTVTANSFRYSTHFSANGNGSKKARKRCWNRIKIYVLPRLMALLLQQKLRLAYSCATMFYYSIRAPTTTTAAGTIKKLHKFLSSWGGKLKNSWRHLVKEKWKGGKLHTRVRQSK